MYRRIVVPLDGSELAELAFDHAVDIAKERNIPILFVRAVDPPTINTVSSLGPRPTFGLSDAVYQEEDQAAKEYLDRVEGRARAAGVKASQVVVWGNAARGVTSVLADGDLLVMSSQGKGRVQRWFLGSVAEAIMKGTSVPVLLIRPQ